MQVRMTFYHLVATIFILFSFEFARAEQCADVLEQKDIESQITEKFSKIANSFAYDDMYEHNWCNLNVIRLYRYLVSQISGLEANDFDVYVVIPRPGTKGKFEVRKPRHPQYWGGDTLNYHVVLGYKDLILDLDYTRETIAVSRKNYFQEMFFPAGKQTLQLDDLQIIQVPGVDYLLRSLTDSRDIQFIRKIKSARVFYFHHFLSDGVS